MRGGGLVWFLAGALTVVVLQQEWLGPLLHGIITALSRIVTFLSALGAGGAFGIGALLALTAVVFILISRKWAEDARAKYDMEKTWRGRQDYRKKPL